MCEGQGTQGKVALEIRHSTSSSSQPPRTFTLSSLCLSMAEAGGGGQVG